MRLKNINLVSKLTAGGLLIVLFVTGASMADGQSATASPLVRNQTITSPTANVTEFDVGGLKVLVKRRTGSQTVAGGLFIRGGIRNIKKEQAGIENFMLSVMSEGGKRFPREALRRELAATGSSISGSSSFDYSVFAFASTLEFFDRTWNAFTDVAIEPAFTNEDIELTREKIVTALANEADEPDSYLSILGNRTLFAGTSYEAEPSGNIETVVGFKAADLRAYHRSIMERSRLLFIVVGDVDPGSVRKKVAETFGKLPLGKYKTPPPPKLDFSRPTMNIETRSLPTNYVKGLFEAPAIGHPDHAAMSVAMSILQEMVFESVRNRENLSYAPNAEISEFAANYGELYVTAVNPNRAITLMLDDVKTLQTDAVRPNVISAISGQFLTRYYLGQETNAAQARELATYELIAGDWRRSQTFLDQVRAVKPEDIQTVARKYLKNYRWVVIGDERAIDRSIFNK